MFDNHTYDLLNQLVQEQKSLWRIKNEYRKNAEGNEDSLAYWEEAEAQKEENIKKLSELVKKYTN